MFTAVAKFSPGLLAWSSYQVTLVSEIICFNACRGLVLNQGSRSLRRIPGSINSTLAMALCTTELPAACSQARPPLDSFCFSTEMVGHSLDHKLGRVVLYGSQYSLSQRVRCPDFHGRYVSDIQNEFVQDQGGGIQIANDVSCVPCHHGPGRGQLPALRKAAASRMNRVRTLPCLAFMPCAGLPCA